jgi:hypothetical protein
MSRKELACDATAAVVKIILTDMSAFREERIILPQGRPTKTLCADLFVQADG